MKRPEIIALYLPQFHLIPENDKWWGKGFTEWTNVKKSKPLFKGHDQPRIPTELGYYDLRDPEIRQKQADLAKLAGVTSFCYWHYWFGNGKRLMADIYDEVLASGKPDFGFCLGWANHSWYSKTWNKDGTTSNNLLIGQEYPGIEDEKMHFELLLRSFKDPRYTKINGKPFFLIYDPVSVPKEYLDNFRKWTKEAGFPDLYLVGEITKSNYIKPMLREKGFDAVVYQGLNYTRHDTLLGKMGKIGHYIDYKLKPIKSFFTKKPAFLYDYRLYYKEFVTKRDYENDVIPQLFTQWDHSPRSGANGVIYWHTEPEYFKKHCMMAFDAIKNKPADGQVLILKSWNEWGEGNYMEPDKTHGRGFINALHDAIDEYYGKE